jgi:hypothetical protein
MNRTEAVDSLKALLCYSDFLFPNYFNIESIDSTHSKVHIRTSTVDSQLLREVAQKLGYSVREEKGELEIF